MSRIRALAYWLRTVATRSRAEDELDEELRDHVDRELQRQLAGGASREEAARRTALRVGNVAAAKDAVRDVRRGRLVADAMTDVRIGLRGLRRTRGFTLAVVLFALALAVVALALAVTGIYGVMAYHVTQRHRENAIRRGLGAGEGQIIGEVMASGLRLAAVGIAFGVVGAVAATRTLGSLLYQVTPQDPAVLAAGVAVLTCAALAACLIPASRAARADPMIILRDE